jgi:hypothetical protein
LCCGLGASQNNSICFEATMTIYIPLWMLWLLGIPVGVFILFCAAIGFLFLFNPPRLFK